MENEEMLETLTDNLETENIQENAISSEAIDAVDAFGQQGKDVMLLSLNQIKPIAEGVFDILKGKKQIFFFEEGVRSGGVAEKFASLLLESGYKGTYDITAVNDCFVKQAKIPELFKQFGFDCDSIVDKISNSK